MRKAIAKISKTGKKLKNISTDECFKYNSKQSFDSQRRKLRTIGASEAGGAFMGQSDFLKYATSRLCKKIGLTLPFIDNMSMRAGKYLENFIFEEFIVKYNGQVSKLYKINIVMVLISIIISRSLTMNLIL